MTVQSKCSGAGADEAAAGTYPSRKKKSKRPISPSSEFESQFSTSGGTVCNLTPSQTARITQPFHRSLIAMVVGKHIHPWDLRRRLRSHLRLAGDLDVSELGLGYFVIKFSESSDYDEALQECPWSIPHLCICVSPWTPNFKPSEAPICPVDVWIRLPELSIEYYDEEILEKIGETMGGRLVKIDPVTRGRIKCKFARICIRIDPCNPLYSTIQFGQNRQKIEYEGLESLCPICRRIDDLKHECLINRSGSSGFVPHHQSARQFQAIGSSSGSISNPPLIPSEPSPPLGSRFQVLENDPLLELNHRPSLVMGESETAAKSSRISSPQVPAKAKAVAKQKELCGVSVQTLPKESSAATIKAPELKKANLIQSVPLAPSAVEDQFRAAKSNNPPQPSPASETALKFYSSAIQQSIRKKEITNTPSKEINVNSCPTVYTINPTITSLEISLSEVRRTTVSHQNPFVIDIVPTSRSGDECVVGSEAVSGSASRPKKMLCWNFRGTDNANLMRALKDLIQLHEPSIVLIFGTKISGADADQVVQELGFYGSYRRKPDGYDGGVWLLLSRQDVQTEVSSYGAHQVSASVHLHSETNKPGFGLLDAGTETSAQPWGQNFFYVPTKWMDTTFPCL